MGFRPMEASSITWRARSGAVEEAFHGLRERGEDALAAVIAAHRAKALRDPAPPVWKRALDGLVALASAASIEALGAALDEKSDPDRRAWIEEAIDQAVQDVPPRDPPLTPAAPANQNS